jgi:hypothetical protein
MPVDKRTFANHYAKCRVCGGQVHAAGPPPEEQDWTVCEHCAANEPVRKPEPTVSTGIEKIMDAAGELISTTITKTPAIKRERDRRARG